MAADVTVADLITPAVGIALTTEHHPASANRADRLSRRPRRD
ncbi:hypothetical protein [Streptomyces sp. NBC_01363]|nr:hypothetical protein [Streptomyces sp. NBC_01363]